MGQGKVGARGGEKMDQEKGQGGKDKTLGINRKRRKMG